MQPAITINAAIAIACATTLDEATRLAMSFMRSTPLCGHVLHAANSFMPPSPSCGQVLHVVLPDQVWAQLIVALDAREPSKIFYAERPVMPVRRLVSHTANIDAEKVRHQCGGNLSAATERCNPRAVRHRAFESIFQCMQTLARDRA